MTCWLALLLFAIASLTAMRTVGPAGLQRVVLGQVPEATLEGRPLAACTIHVNSNSIFGLLCRVRHRAKSD